MLHRCSWCYSYNNFQALLKQFIGYFDYFVFSMATRPFFLAKKETRTFKHLMPDVLSYKCKDLLTEALCESIIMRYSACAPQKFVFCCKSECLLSFFFLAILWFSFENVSLYTVWNNNFILIYMHFGWQEDRL